MRQQLTFYLNQARPGIGLSTDEILDSEQVNFLRTNWDAQTKGAGAGGTPIMTAGLKPVFFDRSAGDGQLADMLKISSQQVALAFRVPLQILGIGQAAVTSTETLMSSWRATGLGFALGHIEEAFGRTFRLRGYPVEYLELNTDMLLRSAFRDQIEALARGVQSGIYAPNEARNRVDLGKVPDGDAPRVQQQMVPLSFGMALDPTAPAPAPSTPTAEDEPADETDSEADDAKHVTGDILSRIHAHARLQ
jgi:HK97 family phage portal protein